MLKILRDCEMTPEEFEALLSNPAITPRIIWRKTWTPLILTVPEQWVSMIFPVTKSIAKLHSRGSLTLEQAVLFHCAILDDVATSSMHDLKEK